MVRTRSVSVMVLVLALWLLAGYAGSEGLHEEANRRRSRRVSAGEEEGVSARAREFERSS
jgi:hypothetical protein